MTHEPRADGHPTGQLLADLARALPPGALSTDADVLATYGRDEADLCDAGAAVALTRPGSTAEVATIMRIATKHRAPVVPQGARTGLAGAANAVEGCVLISTSAMKAIVSLDAADRVAVVQPGVINADLRAAARAQGLYYPPDPGSFETSTIGGNVATNAGGMCCVKYGVTAEYVLGLEVVLADGEVLRCGRRTRKGVAGYDLTRLFVGSEGTLGVITEITLRLRQAPEPALTLAALFRSAEAAGAAVAAINTARVTTSLLELLDQVHLAAIEAYRPQGLPPDAAALLLIAVDSASTAEADLALLSRLCTAAGATSVYRATDAVEADALLAARRLAHPAMAALAERTFSQGALVIDDVAVPVSALPQLLAGVARIATQHQTLIGVVGHAGDGNMHPNIIIDKSNEESMTRGRRAFDAIMALGLSLGGTCTGEHGVGLLKRDWLAREIGEIGLRTHWAIKAALDPMNLLNPGKVLR